MAETTMSNFEDLTIKNYDEIAEAWTTEMAVVSDWADDAVEFKKYLPSGSVIELGCGGGRDAKELIKQGFDYLGTDASAGMINVARKNVPEARFEVINMYELGSLHKTFDGFWACASLLHIPKSRIDEALLAISSSIRDGGIGFISIKDGVREEFEEREYKGRHEGRLFVYWTKNEFIDALKRNGFEVIKYNFRPVSERTNWHKFFVRKIV